MTNTDVEIKYKVCRYHLENSECQLTQPSTLLCQGEANCTFHRLNAEKLCPSCNKKGADWSGYGEHGGFKYTCWSCGHVWTEPLVWPETPGVCLRCGREFTNPVPEVTNPGLIRDIACKGWCAACNAFTMSVVYRWSSAYAVDPKQLDDPLRGGKR